MMFFILCQSSRKLIKNCQGISNLLFLCKESHNKFALILIVWQKWRRSEKTKTDITFDLDVILTYAFF